MTRDERRINELYTAAQDVPPVSQTARLTAAIYIGNTLISIGNNTYKTDPMQAKFSKNFGKNVTCLHAEMMAIKHALRRVSPDDLKRSTLYVARAKRASKSGPWVFGLAKPCRVCQSAIDLFEISRVVYTTNANTFEEITRN